MRTLAASVCQPDAFRRSFLIRSAALGVAFLLPGCAPSGGLRRAEGTVSLNGEPANLRTEVRPGDILTTGPGSSALFVVGQDAFLLRASSGIELYGGKRVPRGTVSGLRLLDGALLAVFGKGQKNIVTATATITLHGCGIYLESSPEQTYFCTCYGTSVVRDGHRRELQLVVADHHLPKIIHADAGEGGMLENARLQNHDDSELVILEGLVGRVPPFRRPRQVSGNKEERASARNS